LGRRRELKVVIQPKGAAVEEFVARASEGEAIRFNVGAEGLMQAAFRAFGHGATQLGSHLTG